MTVYQAGADQVTVVPDLVQGASGLGTALDGFTGVVSLVGGGSLSYWEIYRRQLWVNVAVNKISRGIARLPFKAYRLEEDGDRERVGHDGNPLAALIRRPYRRGTTFRYWNQVLVNLYVHGRSLSAMLSPAPGMPPQELVPLDWRSLRAYVRDGETRFYKWKRGGIEQILMPEEVVTHEFFGGVSPIDPLRQTLALEDAAQRSSIASFANGIMPSGIVTVERSMHDESFDALEESLKAKHGGPDQRFRLAVTDAAVKWQPLSISAVDAALVEQRKLNREETAAAFDIDPTQLGILDRATFSNVSEAHKRLYMDTFGPPITMLEQDFTAQVVEPWLDWWGDIFCEFELDAMLRGDPAERAEAYQKWLNSGVRTPNELRRLENLPAIDHAKARSIYLPLNLEAVGPELAESGTKRAESIGTAAARLGLASKYGVLSADEAREIIDAEELGGPAPESPNRLAGEDAESAAAAVAMLTTDRSEPQNAGSGHTDPEGGDDA